MKNMKTFKLFVILFFTSTQCLAEPDESVKHFFKALNEYQTPEELIEWQTNLNLRLLEHDDVWIRLAAIDSHLSNSSFNKRELHPKFKQEFGNILSQSDQLNSQELIRLHLTCMEKELADACKKS